MEHDEVVVLDAGMRAGTPGGKIELGAADGGPEFHAVVFGDLKGLAVKGRIHEEAGGGGAGHDELPVAPVPD